MIIIIIITIIITIITIIIIIMIITCITIASSAYVTTTNLISMFHRHNCKPHQLHAAASFRPPWLAPQVSESLGRPAFGWPPAGTCESRHPGCAGSSRGK